MPTPSDRDRNRRARVVFAIGGTVEAAMMPYHLTHLRSFVDIDVYVAVTPKALQFVTVPALVAISGNPVYHEDELFFPGSTIPFHNRLGECDLLVVYPASARLISDCATGVVSCPGNRVFAFTPKERVVFVPFLHPAMDPTIYRSHLRTIATLGCRVTLPRSGHAWIESPWAKTERVVCAALGLEMRQSAPEVFSVEDRNREATAPQPGRVGGTVPGVTA